MSLIKEIEYINRISVYLDRFKWVKPNSVANCRCPICGDSAKRKSVARGFFFIKGDKFRYMCHNCGASTTFAYFLKIQYPNVFDDFLFGAYRDKFKDNNERLAKEEELLKEVSRRPIFGNGEKFLSRHAVRVKDLPDDHIAKIQMTERLLPLDDLWYAEKFKELSVSFNDDYKNSRMIEEPRVVIPFRDADGVMFAFQGRSLDPNSTLRYITIKSSEDDMLVYGMDRINLDASIILCVEGPLDSLFLPNCIAVAGSAMNRFLEVLPKDISKKIIFVWDNEPKNRHNIKKMGKLIDSGYKVCVWNRKTPKDINKMIVEGYTVKKILTIIRDSVVSGLKGKVELTRYTGKL